MPQVNLKYGKTTLPIPFDADRFGVLSREVDRTALSDVQIGEMLDKPGGTRPLEDIVSQGETVLLVVPDATRQTGAGQIVNLIVRRMIAGGTAPQDISIIFATGIHR